MSRLLRSRSSGFTLIELLVVVAIIALLIAILLPALGRARDQARNTACLANLKSIALGTYTYATDNDNYLYPSYWHDRQNPSAPSMGLQDILSNYVTQKGASSSSVVYVCPNRTVTTQQYPMCYGANQNAHVYYADNPLYSNTNFPSLVRLTQIKRPFDVIGLADASLSSGAGTSAGWLQGINYTDVNPADGDTLIAFTDNTDTGNYHVRYRHISNASANASFLDGHASSFKIGSIKLRNFAIAY